MRGGGGNDIYVVDNAGDVVTENGGEGTDAVQSSITYKLGGERQQPDADRQRQHQRQGTGSDNVLKGKPAATR